MTDPRNRLRRERSLSDKLWRDKQGHVVVAQVPNAWLVGWIILTFVSVLSASATTEKFFGGLGMICLVVWAGLEIFKGVNYFRRGLGAVVLLMAAYSTFGLGLL